MALDTITFETKTKPDANSSDACSQTREVEVEKTSVLRAPSLEAEALSVLDAATPTGDAGCGNRYSVSQMLQMRMALGPLEEKEGASMVLQTQQSDPLPPRTVFCDLDGVLCDFEAAVAKLFGCPFADVKRRAMWERIQNERYFYARLPWTSDGKEFWGGIASLSPVILTGVPEKWPGAAAVQKRKWARRELGECAPILTCLKSRKVEVCRKGDVLIDDTEDVGRAWEKQGGIFVHHKSTRETLEELKERGIMPPDPRREVMRWAKVWWDKDWWWCKVWARRDEAAEVEFMEPPVCGYRYWAKGEELWWPNEEHGA